ncbi:MAG: hypothetical protein EKK55_07875 [Rhodocyclaceae bacterium]|nr:MAG: hypothetical protein EKK55_07875 [Rhodocyclaceae bacterium]
MAGFIDENHLRKCWDCGTTNEHESRIVPGVLCPKCGSQDTRAIRADHKPKATPGCVMTNDETRAAERLLGNCWDVYIGDPPRDWTEICDKILADGRAVATELDRLRAEVAELVAAIQKYSVYAQARGSAPFGTTAEEQAALARHDAGKGGGE